MSFNFRNADSLINIIEKESRNDYLFIQLKTNYYWWILITGNDNENIRALIQSNAKNSLSNTRIYNDTKRECFWSSEFSHFISHGYLTRLHTLSKNYLQLLSHSKSMLNIIEKTLIKVDDCDCFKFTTGLFHYFIEYARNESNFFKAGLLFYPESNSGYGIKLLNEAAKSENLIISAEANYFLARIYHDNEQKINRAIYHYNILTKLYPNNLIYLYYELNAMIKANYSEEVLLEKKQKAMLSINNNSQLVLNQSNYFKNIFEEIKFE